MDYSLSFILELLEAKGYKNVPKEDFHLFLFPLETQRVCWESQQNIRRCTKTYEMISVDDTAFFETAPDLLPLCPRSISQTRG